MELFHSDIIDGKTVRLGEEESAHCIKVLRHKAGDEINVIDGRGSLLTCRIVDDSPRNATAEITDVRENWGGHPYILRMAVCPTKNMDRYEWFAEKACETGIDEIIPVIGDRSERRTVKTARLEKILVSASKQSLKAKIPSVAEPMKVKDFIGSCSKTAVRLIACCFEDESHPRMSILKALDNAGLQENPEICILIGPEGDFSRDEAAFALENGFVPIHLGPSRLRTETAALNAATCVYSRFLL